MLSISLKQCILQFLVDQTSSTDEALRTTIQCCCLLYQRASNIMHLANGRYIGRNWRLFGLGKLYLRIWKTDVSNRYSWATAQHRRCCAKMIQNNDVRNRPGCATAQHRPCCTKRIQKTIYAMCAIATAAQLSNCATSSALPNFFYQFDPFGMRKSMGQSTNLGDNKELYTIFL